MAFAGGPFNNYTYMSTAAVVDALRSSVSPDPLGAVTTVSGLLTRGALAVWSTQPGELLLDDVGAAAEDATATVPVTGEHHGPATVATATATPFRTYVLADLADGTRWVGTTEDPALTELVTSLESGPVGVQVRVDGASCRLA
jgi:acetyl-CoA C-acetyltransferase